MRLMCLILLFCSSQVFAGYVEQYLLEVEEPQKNPNQSRFQEKTKDALLLVDGVQERADYLLLKIKGLTFGDYTDRVMIIAPLVTGDLEFQANDFRLYYNHFDNEGGVRYNISF